MEKVCSSKPQQLLLLRHLQILSRTIIQNPHGIFHRHLKMEPKASEAGLILQRSITNRFENLPLVTSQVGVST
jgi:hypothetical protein